MSTSATYYTGFPSAFGMPDTPGFDRAVTPSIQHMHPAMHRPRTQTRGSVKGENYDPMIAQMQV